MDALRMISSASENAEEIERLLSCPICLEIYSKPVVILPCQHNLCRKCANDVFQNRGTPMGSGGRFRCPTCRYEVVLDRHGVYGLQRNLLVENIIDMYHSETNKPTFKKAEVVMCEEHEEERVNIYCLTCQKPTCSLCKVFGQHQSCEVSPMEKVQKDQKRELSDSIAILVTGNDRLQAIINQTEELGKMTEANGRKAKSDLCVSFDKLYAILEDRKNTMMAKITSDVQERSHVLQEMMKTYGEQLEEASKLMEASLGLLEERSVPQFLTLARDTINKISEAGKASDVRKPLFNIHNMEEFKVNFSVHEETLESLDFPTSAENAADEKRESCDDLPHCSTSQSPNRTETINIEAESTSAVETDNEEEVAGGDDTGDSDDTVGTSGTSPSDVGSALDRRQSEEGLFRTHSPLTGHDSRGVNQDSRRSLTDESIVPVIKRGRWYDLYVRQLPTSSTTQKNDDENSPLSVVLSRYSSTKVRSTKYDMPSYVSEVDSEEELTEETGIKESDTKGQTASDKRATRRHRSVASLSLHGSPQSSVDFPDSPPPPPATLRRQQAAQDHSPSRRQRRPRSYITHRRRTWSHLLEKKQ